MDARFYNFGYAANPSLMNLSNSFQIGGATGDAGTNSADTTLRLDSCGSPIPFVSDPKGVKRKRSVMQHPVQQFESALSLRLGHSSSSSDSKGSSTTACTSISSAKEIEESSSMDLDLDFTLHLGNERKFGSPTSKPVDVLPKIDLELSLSSGIAESDVTTLHLSSTSPKNVVSHMPVTIGQTLNFEERSSSITGSVLQPLKVTNHRQNGSLFDEVAMEISPAASIHELSYGIITTPKSSVTCASGITQHSQQQRSSSSSSSSTKKCQFNGCVKGARGASGLCIAHGGGRRCQRSGCHKGAEGRTAFCKAHGGGRRCEFLGCTKSAEGRTDRCIAHGGGRRCSNEGCSRAARGKSGLCIRHGGGKRCQRENCTKSAEGLSGLCISHGGGRRCQYPECTKGAQGSTMFCKAHGGGKRCMFDGCTKGAEGSTPFCKGHGGGKRCSFQGGGICPKSVHGGTLFCVAHGGGKRCAIAECTKSARGRTDYCVRHGGGKRCKYDGCGKSAQGSTDFCKSHGGGNRCSWGQPGSELGIGENPCKSFAQGKTRLCVLHGALVQDKRVHGGATVGALVHDSDLPKVEKFKQNLNVDIMKMDVTSSSGSSWKYGGPIPISLRSISINAAGPTPEGRVHGGSLMAMLTGNSSLNFSSNNSGVFGPSELNSGAVGPSELGSSWIHPSWK